MRVVFLIFALFAASFATSARAAVDVAFYARDMGVDLPHTFVTMKGTVRGRPVDSSYGFTALRVTPAMLFGTVPGRIDETEAAYIAKSTRGFNVTVSEAQYDAIMATVAAYRGRPGSDYNINTRNCVHFVAEIARIAGLQATVDAKVRKRPMAFLKALIAANQGRVRLAGS